MSFFIQLFLSSMYEQVTSHSEEGRSEEGETEVNVSPSYISVTLFCLFVEKHSWSYVCINPLLPLSGKHSWHGGWYGWSEPEEISRTGCCKCLFFTISINALKEQINIAYEEENCEDEKKEHLSEVNLDLDSERVGGVKEFVADTSFLFCDWLEFFFDDPSVNGFVQFFLLSMYDSYSYSYYEQVIRHGEEGRPEDRKAEVKVSPSYISVTLFCLFVEKHRCLY